MLIDPENSNGGGGSDQYKDELNPENPRQPAVLGKSQKIAVAALAVFALLILIIWGAQFKKRLSQPFEYKEAENSANEISGGCSGPDCPAVQEALKNKDTDSDGLNDYEELYNHKTSPYLEDSDSDGISDGVEIKNGTDPNCPEGTKCSGDLLTDNQIKSQAPKSELNDDQLELLLNLMEGETAGQDSGATENSLTPEQLKMIAAQMDAATLRQLLISNGMEKSMLDKISDEELMKSFNESIE